MSRNAFGPKSSGNTFTASGGRTLRRCSTSWSCATSSGTKNPNWSRLKVFLRNVFALSGQSCQAQFTWWEPWWWSWWNLALAQALSCCVYKFWGYIYKVYPSMFDYRADPVVHLLLMPDLYSNSPSWNPACLSARKRLEKCNQLSWIGTLQKLLLLQPV